MKKVTFFLVAFLLILGMATVAEATVLTFDDISSKQIGTVPDGYGGLSWKNFGYVNGTTPSRKNSGYDNGRVSGDYVAFNEFQRVSMVGGSVFNFNSTYFAGGWNDFLNIDITGFLKGIPIYWDSIVVDTAGPSLFQADYFGIDSLVLASYDGIPNQNLSGSGTHFAMDNFTFNEINPVPEPATVLLLGTGLATICGLSSRRKKKLEKK